MSLNYNAPEFLEFVKYSNEIVGIYSHCKSDDAQVKEKLHNKPIRLSQLDTFTSKYPECSLRLVTVVSKPSDSMNMDLYNAFNTYLQKNTDSLSCYSNEEDALNTPYEQTQGKNKGQLTITIFAGPSYSTFS